MQTRVLTGTEHHRIPSDHSYCHADWLCAANAQQITGTPGSPSATVTIDGKQLPPPPEVRRRDQGKRQGFQALLAAARRAAQGRAERAAHHDRRPGLRRIGHLRRRHPDAGMDRVAKAGLRYTQFHSTALCSPTRAALITGRNHHSVGFGVIGEMSTGSRATTPSSVRRTPRSARSSRRTATPPRGLARTITRPPINTARPGLSTNGRSGMGFQYFYGFMGGETDQWTPYLSRTHPDFPVGRQERLQPHHRHGGRGHQVHEQL